MLRSLASMCACCGGLFSRRTKSTKVQFVSEREKAANAEAPSRKPSNPDTKPRRSSLTQSPHGQPDGIMRPPSASEAPPSEDAPLTYSGKSVGQSLTAVGTNINADQYETIEDVQAALRDAGLKTAALIVGIDFTNSNVQNGQYTYEGRGLHDVKDDWKNPYEQVIETIARTLSKFDDDGLIPAYGFGDSETKSEAVFSLTERVEGKHRPCKGFEEVVEVYKKVLPKIDFDGPTSFTPIIKKAIEHVRESGEYTVLLIITDGVTLTEEFDRQNIRDASLFPLSIIIVGVGDGPWGQVKMFDDMDGRKFDNLQFVNFEKVKGKADAVFASKALQEIPPQFRSIVQLGYVAVSPRQN